MDNKMAYTNPYTSSSGYKNPYTKKKKKESQYYVPQTMEEWEEVARITGLKKEQTPLQKFLKGTWKGVETVFDVMSTPLYAIAGATKAIVRGDEDPLKEAWKGITWQEKETFSDVLEAGGVKNKYLKFGVGLALDIALDPTTYLGGQGILKNLSKNGKYLTKAGKEILEAGKTKIDDIAKVVNQMDNITEAQKILKIEKAAKRINAQVYKKLRENPDITFKGITLFGQNIVPRGLVTGGTLGRGLEKISPKYGGALYHSLDNKLKTIGGILSNAFSYGKGVTPELPQLVYSAGAFGRKKSDELIGRFYKVYDDAKKKFGKEVGDKAAAEATEKQLLGKFKYGEEIMNLSKQDRKELMDLGFKVPKGKVDFTDKEIYDFVDQMDSMFSSKSGKVLDDLASIGKRTKIQTDIKKQAKGAYNEYKQLDDDATRLLSDIGEERKRVGGEVIPDMGAEEVVAQNLAIEENRKLKKVIDDLGGVKIDGSEEVAGLPRSMKRKNGTPLDDLVISVNERGYNFANGDELKEALMDIQKKGLKPLKNVKESSMNATKELNLDNIDFLTGKEIKTIGGVQEKTNAETMNVISGILKTGVRDDLVKYKQAYKTWAAKQSGEAKKIARKTLEEKAQILKDKLFKIQDDWTKSESLIMRLRNVRERAMDNANEYMRKLLAGEIDGQTVSKEAKEILENLRPELKNLAEFSGMTKSLDYYIPTYGKEQFENMVREFGGKRLAATEIEKFFNKIAQGKELKNPMTALSMKTRENVRRVLGEQTLKEAIDVWGISPKEFKALTSGKSGYSAVKIKGKLAGFLRREDFEFINNAMYPEFRTVDQLARTLGYDQFTSLFKRAVTSLFPAFHIRNMLSGVVQNYEVLGSQAFNPANWFGDNLKVMKSMKKGSEELVNWGGQSRKLRELTEPFWNRFFQSSRYSIDNRTVDNVVDTMVGFKKKKMFAPEKVGEFIELNQKASAYVTALKQGFSVEDALRLAEEAGFDYKVMSNFEQSVMKRIIPFYAFARKNAALQVKTAISTPARILNQKKLLNAFSGIFGGDKITQEDVEGMPEWVQKAIKVKVKDGKVMSGLDFPIQEFLGRVVDPVGSTLISMNPLLKFPVEAKIGYDFFRKKDIKELDTISKPLYEALSSPYAPKWFKDLFQARAYEIDQKAGKEIGQKKTIYSADPQALHVLRNIPISRLVTTMENIFGEGEQSEKMLSLLLGAKIYDIDVELQKYLESRDLQAEWAADLQRQGKGYTFKRFLLNKEEMEEDTTEEE